MSERGVSKTHTLVGGVKNGVEAFKECKTVNEVKALAGRTTDIIDDEVDAVGVSANDRVERPGPRLSIRCELEVNL